MDTPSTEQQSCPAGRRAISVTAAIAIAKSILSERTFCIVGEVSELSNKPGYKAVYFTIKDKDSSLPCMMWVNRYKSAGVVLRLGMQVEVTGKFTIFAPKGRMNFDVSSIKLAGEGDLRQQVAQLAIKLRKEGLMDEARKRQLLDFPETIGLVTSPRGAAVHDVLRTLRRRYPMGKVIFAGVNVEGKTAPVDIINALQTVINAGAQEVLLVRGGGSFEDLMPFNDEKLARFIAASPVPVVTGIGHEPDTSIADMVADVRASTPTGAAQMVSPDQEELLSRFSVQAQRLYRTFSHRLKSSSAYLDALESRSIFHDPMVLFGKDSQLLDYFHSRLEAHLTQVVNRPINQLETLALRLRNVLPQTIKVYEAQIDYVSSSLVRAFDTTFNANADDFKLSQVVFKQLGEKLLLEFNHTISLVANSLENYSPLKTLSRGWSITKNKEGDVVRLVEQVLPDESLEIQVYDGRIYCRVEKCSKELLLSSNDFKELNR